MRARLEQYCMSAGGPRGGPGWRPSGQAGRSSSAMVGNMSKHALNHMHTSNLNPAPRAPPPSQVHGDVSSRRALLYDRLVSGLRVPPLGEMGLGKVQFSPSGVRKGR